ncbi:MAG: peptide chain release factor N(5)-glutamine methyltransferase [Victivallales bacterium]|nr:peptide chain release factor N(5)-glutamine methyltransferase [Victivallales bacterium]
MMQSAGAQLLEAGIENGLQEARWIFSQSLRDARDGASFASLFQSRVSERAKGRPLQYVLGTAEFYNVELEVGPGVLIPRPETERLVELVLEWYAGGDILDLCTGSGAIALALAKELPSTHVTAVDISAEALAYAKRNLARLELKNVTLLEGDLFAPVPQGKRFGLIVSNPPYVSEEEFASVDAVVREYEPRLALVAEEDGLAVLRRIATGGREFLNPGGCLFCEMGETQGERAASIFRESGLKKVEVLRDYAGRERFVTGCLPEA